MALAVSRPWSIKSIRDHNQLTEENDIDNKCDWTELDHYYGLVKRQILRYQSPTSHLFPITSTDTEHGSIRDSVYCAVAIWALHQAYRRRDDDLGKASELGQSAVACMRGVLNCWKRQAHRLELWKAGQNPKFALHTAVALHTGEEVLDPGEYHHLQLDCVSLYLIYLVQMVTSGLEIIYSMEEVALVQNLVYYIERTYRTPDFGTWGRGTKYNDGNPEVHASSIGMAKAALEAVNGFNLFGDRGSSCSVIYADIDAHNRNRSIFETLLPRESNTKNTDAALLPTISFPAFATQNEALYKSTKSRIVDQLRGDYGFKRFIRDGFGTELEVAGRRYYQRGETVDFQGVENEWPIFFIFMIIDGVFKDLPQQVKEYQLLLDSAMTRDPLSGDPLLPRMYSIPSAAVDKERCAPRSVKRKITRSQLDMKRLVEEEHDGEVFLWGQALFTISQLLTQGLLHLPELDPISRYLPCTARQKPPGRYSTYLGLAPRKDCGIKYANMLGNKASSDLLIQVVLISESTRLQCMLANYGIQTQTPTEVEPVQVWPPGEMVRLLASMGSSPSLGLGGRPSRPIGSLGTSKLYRVAGKTVLCYPIIFSASDFYLYHDMALLTEDIREELRFINKHWRLLGRPTFAILISENDMRDPQFGEMVKLLAELRQGHCKGVKVKLGRLQNLISSACIEHLDFLPDQEAERIDALPLQQMAISYAGYQSLTDIPRFVPMQEEVVDYASRYQDVPSWEVAEIARNCGHLLGSIQLCGLLLRREGPCYMIGEDNVLERLRRAYQDAGRLRYWAALRYSSALLGQLVDSLCPCATQILVNGKTLTVGTVGGERTEFAKPFSPQEVHAALYNNVAPHHVVGAVLQQEIILTCGRLIETQRDLFQGILVLRMGWIELSLEKYHGFLNAEDRRPLAELSPHELRQMLISMLEDTTGKSARLSAHQVSVLNGCLSRVPDDFFPSVFFVLQNCEGGIKFRNSHLPQRPTISIMEPNELSFAHMVDQHLVEYTEPWYRSLLVRALSILATVLRRNPEFSLPGALDMEEILRSAHKLFLGQTENSGEKDEDLEQFRVEEQSKVDIYLARSIVNHLLGPALPCFKESSECKMQ